LLSSLEGYAITTIKIEGVEHEFSTIPGVIEDVTEMILNLKQIRFKKVVDGLRQRKVSVTILVRINLKLEISIISSRDSEFLIRNY